MEDKHRRLLETLIKAVTEGKGHLASEIRKSLLSGKTKAGALGSFAIKVAQNAASIREEHIQAMLKAGHSEDAIFECVVVASLGAGLERLNAGRAALGIDDAAK